MGVTTEVGAFYARVGRLPQATTLTYGGWNEWGYLIDQQRAAWADTLPTLSATSRGKEEAEDRPLPQTAHRHNCLERYIACEVYELLTNPHPPTHTTDLRTLRQHVADHLTRSVAVHGQERHRGRLV